MDKLELHYNGKFLTGFDQVVVSNTIDEIAGYFSLKIPLRSESIARGLSLPEIDTVVSLIVDGKVLLKGYVEVIETESRRDGSVSYFYGREITSDIIDSSITYSKRLSGPLDRVIREILTPFRIEVISYSDLPVEITTEKGTPVWDTIEILARKTGNILWSRGDGVLIIGPGPRKHLPNILTDSNAKSSLSRFSSNEIFSEYIVMSSVPSSADRWGSESKKTVSVKGSSKRYRPLILRGENSLNESEALSRAQWEASIREARSIVAKATIAGFKIGTMIPSVNDLVDINLEWIGIKSQMLISSLRYSYSKSDGSSTEIGFSLPNAYLSKPIDTEANRKEARKNLGWS